MVIQRTFEVCSQGVVEARQTHVFAVQIGSAVFAHVTESSTPVNHTMLLLEEGGRVIDTQTGAITSCGDGTNSFDILSAER